jgi:hypothetical protein
MNTQQLKTDGQYITTQIPIRKFHLGFLSVAAGTTGRKPEYESGDDTGARIVLELDLARSSSFVQFEDEHGRAGVIDQPRRIKLVLAGNSSLPEIVAGLLHMASALEGTVYSEADGEQWEREPEEFEVELIEGVPMAEVHCAPLSETLIVAPIMA